MNNPDTPPTTRVRIKVLINADGRYAAYGYTDCSEPGGHDEVLWDMMSAEDDTNIREYFVTAMIPTPQRVEVVGEIDPVSVEAVSNG